MDANELVLKALSDSDKPLKSAELAQISGLDKKEVDKAIKNRRENRITKSLLLLC